MPIDKTLTINVFNVCESNGSNCASTGFASDLFYAAATNAIWSQAGISISYNYKGAINNSLFTSIDDSAGSGHGFWDLQKTYGYADYSNNIVDMFLVNDINHGAAYGEGWLNAAGLVMDIDMIMNYGSGNPAYPLGRIDTMAHELGHNLGLVPTYDPEYAGSYDPGHSNKPYELMASGTIRDVPGTIADVYPNGEGLDQLSSFQISIARRSDILVPVPEPETYAMLLAGLGLMAGVARRRSTRA